jgi:hypothetical protein
MATRYGLIGNFGEKIAKHWRAAKLAWFVAGIVLCYPKTSKPVYEDNLKLPLMAKPNNLEMLHHEGGSWSHKEILETATEDALIPYSNCSRIAVRIFVPSLFQFQTHFRLYAGTG